MTPEAAGKAGVARIGRTVRFVGIEVVDDQEDGAAILLAQPSERLPGERVRLPAPLVLAEIRIVELEPLAQATPVIRPELDQALVGTATLQMALIPSANARRVLEAALPGRRGAR